MSVGLGDLFGKTGRFERERQQRPRRTLMRSNGLLSFEGTAGSATTIDGSGSESWALGDVGWTAEAPSGLAADIYVCTIVWRLDISVNRAATFASAASGAGDWRLTSGLNDFASTVSYAAATGDLYIDGALSSTCEVHGLVAADSATPSVRVLLRPTGVGPL